MMEIVITTKQEYLNTSTHLLNNMFRNGWSAYNDPTDKDLMVFIR